MAGGPEREGVAMSRIRVERLASGALLASLLMLSSSCAIESGYGYDGGANVGLGIDYYEPFGYDYGGWGPSYRSGPSRGGARGFRDGGRGSPHAYRPAPASHAMPSIPSGPRSGGRGGGRR